MKLDEFKNIITSSSKNEWIHNIELEKYIYKNDISISVVEDKSWNNGEEFKYFEKWATNYSNINSYKKRFLLKYNGEAIYSFYCIAVDGYGCFLPYPENLRTMKVTKENYVFAKFINEINVDYNQFDKYFERSGLIL